ncbi:flavodoxin family protein [Actinophytocola sp.]|uniref:flavodoxin family protein n=1 Tax=Actinophytocola sp. TaxID=1872138 RepID=UPI00389AC7AC
MTKVAVIYYSSSGNVHKLAVAAAAAAEKEGAEVRLRRIPELVAEPPVIDRAAWAEHRAATEDVPEAGLDDLDWADAVLVGTPVRFGLPAPQLLHFIDTTARLSIPGRLRNKAVSAFTSGSAPHGGQVTAILALHNAFCHWGSLIVPTGSTEPVLFEPNNGNPYGVASVSRNRPGNVHEENLAAVEFQARRTVEVARALVTGFAAAA